MKELIGRLVSQADLSEAQAEKVADVVKGFLEERLPEAIRGTVMSHLTGQNVDSAASAIKGALGGLF